MIALPETPDPAARRFILNLARALHRNGTPAHQLESALSTVAEKLGLEAEFFSTPTSIMIGVGSLEEQRVHLLRVEPGEPNLRMLSRLGDITREVTDGTLSPTGGLARVAALDASPPHYPAWLTLLAFVLASRPWRRSSRSAPATS